MKCTPLEKTHTFDVWKLGVGLVIELLFTNKIHNNIYLQSIMLCQLIGLKVLLCSFTHRHD